MHAYSGTYMYLHPVLQVLNYDVFLECTCTGTDRYGTGTGTTGTCSTCSSTCSTLEKQYIVVYT